MNPAKDELFIIYNAEEVDPKLDLDLNKMLIKHKFNEYKAITEINGTRILMFKRHT